jgi:hypothetical protein
MAPATTLRLVDSDPQIAPLPPKTIELPEGENSNVSYENGALKIEHEDGSATIDFNPDLSDTGDKPDDKEFGRNIASDIDTGVLAKIASDLIAGIEYDEQSRKDWLDTRARGITLLGLKLEEPRGDVGTSGAPLEGMSTIRHPLLLDATVRFQATARGELLPATGPVKVRNDQTAKPMNAPDPNTGDSLDELGDALETDMNHYLTVTATEYVPDTDRMLFYIGFGGDGFKKVYNCPIRRRPVSESVDAEDIVVSNAATDIRNCGRVTHKIKMRPSVLKRMQIIKAYRDVSLTSPSPSETDPVKRKKAEIAGYRAESVRPEDADYQLYECYCECDIPEFAPEQFKDKGLPLPYVVTLEKDSRQVLAVRRNWDEEDEQCLAKQFFVQFPFIRGLGFYGIGLIHLLGNVTVTLTAVWREFIDSGMFANFPGLLIAKGAGRQLTNQIRVPPGGAQALEVPPGMRIQDAAMPLPYREPGAGFTGFIQHVEELGQRLGQTADISVGEGKQETPVGTTMALIEQATKVMDSVHKRLHAAQAEEFGLLKERFREDPEAFWRHRKRPGAWKWTIDQFKQALQIRELVPVSDPNNPTSLHRIAKAIALLTLSQQFSTFFNPLAVLKRVLRVSGIDAEGLLNAVPTQPPPDPRMEAIKAKAAAEAQMAQIQRFQAALKLKQMQLDSADKAADRKSRETVEQLQIELEKMRVQQEAIIHSHDMQRDDRESQQGMENDRMEAAHGMVLDHIQNQQKLAMDAQKHGQQMQVDQHKAHQQVAVDLVKHQAQMEKDRQANQQKMAAERQAHEEKMHQDRVQHAHDLELEREKHQMELQHAKEAHAAELKQQEAMAKAADTPTQRAAHQQEMKQSDESHQQKIKQSGEAHEMRLKQDAEKTKVTLQQKKAMARAKPKPSGGK